MHQNMEEHIEIDFPPMEKGEVKKAEWTRLLQNSGNKTRKFRRKKKLKTSSTFFWKFKHYKNLDYVCETICLRKIYFFFCSPPPPRDPGSADYINIYYLFLSRYDIYPTQTKKSYGKNACKLHYSLLVF